MISLPNDVVERRNNNLVRNMISVGFPVGSVVTHVLVMVYLSIDDDWLNIACL